MKDTPKGWPRISSAFFYDDAKAAIAWLVRVFGFEVRLLVEGENGRVEHSELTYGDGLVMVGTTGGKSSRDVPLPCASPRAVGGSNTQALCVFVDDVDAHCAHARAEGATKRYGSELALDRVDLEVRRGELVGLLGPNGAGKSTLVTLLTGGRRPTAGRVELCGGDPRNRRTRVSIIVESLTPTPIVVERSMWWRATAAGEWIESHNNRAVTTTASRWLVADGESGGPGDASTYVLVANTGGSAMKVNFTLLSESGEVRTVQDTVTANGRYSMDVAGTFPEARGNKFSLLVEGVSALAPLVVERASYSSTSRTTRSARGSGTCVAATRRSRTPTWSSKARTGSSWSRIPES